MYSLSTVPVDKGLGFDFSSIADFVKTAATTGLGVYKQQMQLKQVRTLAQAGMQSNLPNPNGIPNSNPYGIYQSMLPMAPYVTGQQLNLPQPGYPQQQSSMIDTGTMLTIGGLVVGGILLFKLIKG